VIDSILMLGAQQQVGTDKVQASCGLMVRQDMTEVPLSKALNPPIDSQAQQQKWLPTVCASTVCSVCVLYSLLLMSVH